ncbi:MAG: MotE family protein [Acetobacteraceae bacterium]
MTRRPIPQPRLLPLTIAVLAALLGMKTVGLVRAVAPALAAPAAHPMTHATIGAAVPQAVAPPPAVSPAEAALLSDLRARRKLLDRRAATLSAREALLAAAEKRLDQRVAELKTLEAKLQARAKARAARDNAAWAGLVDLYQTMQPRQAAKIFDKLRMKVLLAVIDRMAPRRAGAILAAMQPDRAREVTDRLAALRLARDGAAHPASGS